MASYSMIPKVVESDKFTGNHHWGNPGTHYEMSRCLQTLGLIGLTILHAIPRSPDSPQRRIDFFLNDGWYAGPYPDHQPQYRDDGRPLSMDEIAANPVLMQEYSDGHLQAIADGDPDYAIGSIFDIADLVFHFTYGDTMAERRLRASDYMKQQSADKTMYDSYLSQVVLFFLVLDAHCTATGQDCYKEFLPNAAGPGDTVRAYLATEDRMGLDVSAATYVLSSLHSDRIKFPSECIADYQKRCDQAIVNLGRMGEIVSPLVQASILCTAIKSHQCPISKPYGYVLDRHRIERGTLANLKAGLSTTERTLMSEEPFTSSGRPKPNPNKKLSGQSSASAASHHTEDEEANAAREPYCPGCQVLGHTLRDGDCPKFWWCKKCEWAHNNNDVCDNKAAKNEFLKKKGERKSGGGGGRGSGGRGGN